jgi:hypothetical protein
MIEWVGCSLDFLLGRSQVQITIQNSSVGIATGWTAPVRFPTGQDFSLLHSVQSGSEAHPASSPMAIGGESAGA